MSRKNLWKKVLWTNETKMNFSNCLVNRSWSVKQGGGGVMASARTAASGAGPLIIMDVI